MQIYEFAQYLKGLHTLNHILIIGILRSFVVKWIYNILCYKQSRKEHTFEIIEYHVKIHQCKVFL